MKENIPTTINYKYSFVDCILVKDSEFHMKEKNKFWNEDLPNLSKVLMFLI